MPLDFFSTYSLRAAVEEIRPEKFFFKDRYFPTDADDIFGTSKVLTEYKKGSRKMAAFVSDRGSSIPLERTGYSVSEFAPPKISVSRSLTSDDLTKRGFGEAIYANTKPAERAARLQVKDFTEMDATITRREEWMCVQTMMNNGCTMQEYVDAKTKGAVKYIKFYEGDSSPHEYTVANPWNGKSANLIGDVHAMCKLLTTRGLNPTDLIIGSDVADVFYNDETLGRLIDKNSGIIVGEINEKIVYPGVSVLADRINFRGHNLKIFVVDTSYEDENGIDTPYFPKDSVMVTFPGCGHLTYGSDTHIPYGQKDFATFTGTRIPKFTLDQPNDVRAQTLISHPLPVPVAFCPYIYAKNVIS